MSYIVLFFIFCFYHVIRARLNGKISYIDIFKDGFFFFLFHEILFFLMEKSLFYTFSFVHIIFLFIHTFLYYFVKESWFKRHDINPKMKGFYLLVFAICFSISYIGEFTIFNYKHYSTFTNKEETLKFHYHGLKKQSGNQYIITRDKNVYIEAENINITLNTVLLPIFSKYSKIPISITTYVKDEANLLYYRLGRKETLSFIKTSQYFMCHASGKVKDIKFVFDEKLKGTIIEIHPILLNPTVPFFLNIYRILFFTLLLFFLYLIRPSSFLYTYKATEKFQFKKAILGAFILAFFLFILFFTDMNPGFSYADVDVKGQYYALSESLLEGKFYLPMKPSKKLKELSNPYDSVYRAKHLTRNKDYYWDTAYYKGKYYVYFGITPVLVLFLPYYAIMHVHFPIATSIALFSFFSIIGVFYLLYQIIQRWFSKTSFIHYLLCCLLFISSSGLFYIIKRPTFYHIPIVCGFLFMIWGLGFWISATISFKRRKLKLFLGSLFMALVVGARPQLFVSFLFAPFIFYQDIFKKRTLFSKKSIMETFLFILPILIFAIFLMYYNYARFSSIFDFGANYNLTTNDMTKRGFVLDRIPSGIFAFLFQPTIIQPIFPYIFANHISTNYLGRVISEPFFGGFLYNHIIFVILFFSYKFKHYFKSKETYYMIFLSLFLVFVVIIFDTENAGMLPRYIADFAYLFNIGFCFLSFSIDSNLRDKKKRKAYLKLFLLLLMESFLYEFFFLFTDISLTIRNWNPKVYYTVSYFLQFWV